MKQIQIVTDDPIVAAMGQMQLMPEGLKEMMEWVRLTNPEAIPEEYDDPEYMPPNGGNGLGRAAALFPHNLERADGTLLSHNELLIELGGRKCYNSFGNKAGKKTNEEYIANTQSGKVAHASIVYHAKISFFIAGVSRRVSHELIRHYVGADRDEEGSPSQESTRYVEHSGRFIAHPRILNDAIELNIFRMQMQTQYNAYLAYISRENEKYREAKGEYPKGMERKRIFESASPNLPHSCETSWVWTTNPIALAKLCWERDDDGADLEFRRLARKMKRIAVKTWPNAFPQAHMREALNT